MGSSAKSSLLDASPAFVAAFRERAGAGAELSFADFMDLALYHPKVGYYRQTRRRIGYGGETDFFTSATSGSIFGELMAAAIVCLLNGQEPREFILVEIGAEPDAGILRDVSHPFGAYQTIPLGYPITLSGRLVVFSNELFDAQPFRRFVGQGGRWKELGVKLQGNRLEESVMTRPAPPGLPATVADGYHLDVPWRARELMRQISSQSWQGLMVACDYGKSWAEICTAYPHGTARAYHRHQQSNNLLTLPGAQDLTCHVCWDWLMEEITDQGFRAATIESQETFLVRHAGDFIRDVIARDATQFTQRKLALTQLIHPAHLGHKFQVLHGMRP